MAFIKAVSTIFLAATAVFIKTVGPFQQQEESKPLKTITATNFTVPTAFNVTDGSARLTINFKYSDDESGALQERSCMIFAQPEGWTGGDQRLNGENFKGNEVLEKIRKKLGTDDESTKSDREGFAKSCSKNVGGFLSMFYDLVSGEDGSWNFATQDVDGTFAGTYESKGDVAKSD